MTQNPDGSWKVVDLRAGSPDGTDTLKNIDFLQFSDTTVAIGSVPPPPPTVSHTGDQRGHARHRQPYRRHHQRQYPHARRHRAGQCHRQGL